MATTQQKLDAFKYARAVILKAAEGGGDVGRLPATLENIYKMTLNILEDIGRGEGEQAENAPEAAEQADSGPADAEPAA